MLEILQEISSSLKRNKLRTFLTGFAVAWGIFMLMVLLGAGNGIIHASMANFEENALNAIYVYPGTTTLPYHGLDKDRNIRLDNRDLDATQNTFAQNVTDAGATLAQSNITLSYGKEYVSLTLRGVHPNYQSTNALKMPQGRFINHKDIQDKRKVIIIHEKTAEILFKHAHVSPIGQFLNANGVMYQVAGVFADRGNQQPNEACIPFSTLQTIYNKGNQLDMIAFRTKGLTSEGLNTRFEADYRKAIGAIHHFDPKDEGAIWIANTFTQFLQMNNALGMLRVALWVIGLFTLISGIVGVSNIMLITVKERTHEFGIRKALGARPFSIEKLIIVESVIITSLFGYVGLVLGVAATEWMNSKFGSGTVDIGSGMTTSIFVDSTVDLSIAIQATLTLIIAGTLAGFFPARKAAHVKPIEALNASML